MWRRRLTWLALVPALTSHAAGDNPHPESQPRLEGFLPPSPHRKGEHWKSPSRGQHTLIAAPSPAGSTPAVAYPATPLLSEESLSAYRRKLVGDNLQLKPETAAGFWPLYDKFQKELDVLREKRHGILIKLGENFNNMSDADALEYIQGKLDLENEHARIYRRAILEMGKVLAPRDLARFVQIEGKISAFIEAGIEEEIPLLK